MLNISDGLLIINVSSSSSPTLIGRYETSFNSINDVAISPDGNTAYVAGGDDGLLIVNISNPASPSLLSSYSVSDNCTIDGQPVFEGNCSAGGVTLSGDGQIAYVAAAWGGIQILDVSQPDTPVLVGTMEAGVSLIGKLILSGDELIGYSIGSGGVGGQPFRILGLTDRTSPTVIGTFITDLGGYGAIELSTDGTRIYLGGINIGFSILDVSDPTSPSLQATFFEIIDERAPNVAGLDVTTDGSVAYLATVVDGVRIVDLSSLNSATVGAPPR